MSSNNIDERINEFSNKTIEAFQFLENEYSYIRNDLERRGFEDTRSREVFIRYFSKKVAVEVIWEIGESLVAVGLYELQDGKIPEKISAYGEEGHGRAINLDSLVRMLTDGEVKSPIPEHAGDISFSEMCRRAEKATEMIKTDMDGILKNFAERLKKYASDILKGDTSIFPRVQEHHRKYWEVEI